MVLKCSLSILANIAKVEFSWITIFVCCIIVEIILSLLLQLLWRLKYVIAWDYSKLSFYFRTSSDSIQEQEAVAAPEDLTDDGPVQEEESKLTQRNLRWLFWNTISRFVVHLSVLVLRFLELYLSAGLLLCIIIVAIQQVVRQQLSGKPVSHLAVSWVVSMTVWQSVGCRLVRFQLKTQISNVQLYSEHPRLSKRLWPNSEIGELVNWTVRLSEDVWICQSKMGYFRLSMMAMVFLLTLRYLQLLSTSVYGAPQQYQTCCYWYNDTVALPSSYHVCSNALLCIAPAELYTRILMCSVSVLFEELRIWRKHCIIYRGDQRLSLHLPWVVWFTVSWHMMFVHLIQIQSVSLSGDQPASESQ